MKISDYEFLYNIDPLFEKKIVIYGGAGLNVRCMYDMLMEIPVNVECFCGENILVQRSLSVPVISIDELKNKIQKKDDYFVIIESSEYFEEYIEELEKNQIEAYICTEKAVRIGIEVNIDDRRIPDSFRDGLRQRRNIWSQNYEITSNSITHKALNVYPNAIIVYQAKKVGSCTIHRALKREQIPSVHVHYLTKHRGVPAIDGGLEYLRKRIKEDGVKIISLVREPIARGLSYFMQGFTWDFVSPDRCLSPDIEAEACRWVSDLLEENEEFEWFDREIKELTGIDVYQYPFDREQGYAWIKEGKTEILLLKTETLRQNVDKVGEFVGCPGIELVDQNVGSDKAYKYIYQQLKNNFKVRADAVQKQYENNVKYSHFYSQEETKVFLEKWSSHIIND